MVYRSRIRGNADRRPQAFWGALIPAAINFVGGLITSSQQAKAQKRALEEQQRLAQQQLQISNQNQLASTLNNYANAQQSYDDKDYNLKYRIGGVKRLGGRNIMITDGGNAKRIGNNTYLLRGGSHEDINETGQTGIGINVGGNEIEAEGGEVAQRKGNSLRIYSAQPILGGMSPAQAIMRGYNKNKVFAAQQRFKRNNNLNDDGSKQRNGGLTSKDRGSSKHPYPSVASKDFAGGNRSYPIPTKADAVDALRLAGLHGRSDVRSKVYSKYPELRKKAKFGDWFTSLFNSNNNTAVPKKTVHFYKSKSGKVFKTIREAAQDNYKYNNNPSYRLVDKAAKYARSLTKQDITMPYIKNKAVTLDKAGRATGARVSTNQLDSIAKYANRAGLSIPTAFGLVMKESTFNNPTLYGTQFIQNKNNGSTSGSWISNYNWSYMRNPYDETLRATLRNKKNKTKKDINNQLANGEKYADKLAEKLKAQPFITGIEDGFRKYKTNPYGYNPGQKDYVQLVNQNARDIMNSPQIQQWYKTSPYAKGRKYKCGGRIKAKIGANIGINTNINIPDYTNTYINWLISQLPSEKNKQQVAEYNKEDIDNAVNAANLVYQNYLIRQLPSGKSNKQEDNKQENNKPTRYITADELKRNTQSLVDASRRSVDFVNNIYRSKLISQLQPEDKRSLKDKTQSIVDAANFAVNNAINYRNSKLISQLPNKQDSKENNKKEKNKVVKHQIKTTPQYKGNTTKGNYQLHDGETKVINGIKYTRRGDTIINHKTNVGYIYDKDGNYTGQADYSKVGKNFNDAFDAARADGRSQFIYRAGKYNNYSTAKETDAKKEALNRRIGTRRIAKRFGGLEHARRKYLPGGVANPWDEYKVPDYGGTAPWQVSNKYDVNVPYPIGKYDLPITTITAKKDNFNDEMSRRMRAGVQNLKDNSYSKTTVPYLGRQNTFKPATQDYIGLGIDTLAALGSGLFTRSAYNKLNFDYALPNYVDESPVAFDTIYHNESQRANVERNRLNSRDLIRDNTSSAQTALGRMQQTDTDAMIELNKLADEKANKEVELRNQNAANEQQVRARNAAARNQYYQNIAQIKNAALEAKNNAALAKAQSIGADLSGLSQAWTNFAGSVEQRYNTRQNEAIIAATSKEPAVLSNALQFGYNFSPEVLASIYRSTNDDKLKQLALSRLSPSDRRRYSLFQ